MLAGSPMPAPADTASPGKPGGVPVPIPLLPEKLSDGMVVPLNDGTMLRIQVYADNVVRVAVAKDRAFFTRSTPATEVRRQEKTHWQLDTQKNVATLSTAKLQVHVNLVTGAVSFFDTAGKPVLAEKSGSRALTSAEVQGESTFHVCQQWEPNADESLYGLGQRQIGILDIKGWDLDLWQHNTHVVVPFLVSSRGYGVLWDNLSFTRFGDLRQFMPIPADCLVDISNQPGGLTTGTFTDANADELQNPHSTNVVAFEGGRRVPRLRAWHRWEGELVAPATGDYQFKTYSNGRIRMWLDGKLVVDHWRQNWLTDSDQIKVRLEAGHHYALKLEHGGDEASTMQLTWKTPNHDDSTSLWSEVADGEDYYFVYGPALDTVIAGFRQLTGRASLMPEWAFGLWQSRQRYETAQQSLDVVDEFRRRAIPFDNIVQDWQYWHSNDWGSHRFDPVRFPDPDGWLKALHDRHAHVMISVWGKFYTGTTNFDALQKAGFLYQPNLQEGLIDWIGFPYTFYDAFNPGARKLFWSQINTGLFRKGIDAWWMDATEPDLTPSPPTLEGQRSHLMPTAAGTASRELNGYALLNSKGVYEGQRSVAPDQRVFILTRSGFAGIQRYATATWSGDTTATWTGLAKQIPAGLGFCVSGMPYWTMDIGGYTMDTRFSATNQTPKATEEWRELNTRWFQFGTFCPLTRLHGELKPREPWTFGGDDHPAYQTIVKFDRLRYRLLPYLYSLAGAMTQDAGTMMRPLVMDFSSDTKAREIVDEYMFGPTLLVAPVTTYQARSRNVYLPSTAGDWYDFWTGTSTPGGQTIDAPAPYDSLPLYVRAGSIIPFGPDLQYTGEKPADPITLYVYAGADGAFTLYEDDGLTYGYEKGAFARIPIRWDEKSQTLTLGKREGSFKGMLQQRTFNVVLVTPDKPVDFSFAPSPDRTMTYNGEAVSVAFETVAKERPLYLDAGQPVEKRVEDLLRCMTLEEKISQVHADSKFSTAAVPRLGIPRRWFADGPHGVREDVGPYSWNAAGRTDDYATWLPALSALGSTWNEDLAAAFGNVLGQESRARNKDVLLAPIVDIARTPICGRIYEYLGEDPYLNARLGVKYIEGVQSNGVAACVKHFVGNNQEDGRGSINMDMDDRALREIYLPPFEAAVKEAHVWAVMGAYPKFRGEYCAYSDYLINKLLKGEWGFPGLVMSDWSGTHSMREAALGGLDVEMGTLVGSEDKSAYANFFLANRFRDALRTNGIPMSVLDDKVRRSLRVMFATGVFDPRPPGSLNTPEHRATAQRIAEESMVLLKNETNALPLNVANLTSVAVIGENAVRHNAAGFFGAGVKTMYEVTPLDGIEQFVGGRVNVTYSAGYSKSGADSNLVERAVTAARQADVAIVVAGFNHSRNLDDEGWDRTNLCLPYGQDELIQKVVAANPRTIVVLVSGPAIELGSWLAQVPAVLQAHYSGMEGGHALARILFGDVNPSGKLTVTYPRQLSDSPAHALDTYPGTNGTLFYKEGLLVGYRWFDTKNIEPAFPFGYGLSYTTFEYSNLKLVPGAGTNGPVVTAEFDLMNTGSRAGAEVAQLYVHQENPAWPRPLKELKGFKKIFLQPGEKRTVSLPLDQRAFAFYDPAKVAWVAQSDDYKIQIGSSSRDIHLQNNFHLQ